jgi:hypothetical protein
MYASSVHSALIPNSLMMAHHFSASAFTTAPSASGVCRERGTMQTYLTERGLHGEPPVEFNRHRPFQAAPAAVRSSPLIRRASSRLTGSTPGPLPQAVRHAIRESSAWAPIPGTTSTATPAQGWQPTPRDDGLPSADRSPGLCRSPGRTHRARVSLRSARPGSSATTACPGWRQAARSSVRCTRR